MRRGLFAAALVAGASFTIAAWAGWHGAAIVLWKGAGVALLAVSAARSARSPDEWMLAAVMACGAIGDVLIEFGLIPGALAFLAGHLVAIALYRRHGAQARPIAAGAVIVAAAAYAIARDIGVAVYALGLGGMAGAALDSSLPRRVALGAWLFVASDLLIFAQAGPLAGSAIPRLLIWPLYFAGQALIAHGAGTALRGREAA